MYEDYLEEFVFKTTKIIAEKLFGKKTIDDVNPTNPTMRPLAIQPSQNAQKATIPQTESSSDAPKNYASESNYAEKKGEPWNTPVESTEASAAKDSEIALAEKSDVAVVERENSFEVLYNQLDPADIAELTEPEPVDDPNETEEEKQNKIALEAGSSLTAFCT